MKIAVITGVSRGIGECVARLLLNDGWKIYGLSRTKPPISHANFEWLKCDLAAPDSIVPAMRVIQDVSIELVISNAGVAFEESASTVSKESYERMFLVNTLAPMLLVSSLRSKIHHAAIISISSVSDRIVEKDFALYCASKAANTRYFESLAHELKEAKVFTLLPDYVDTTMLRELQAGRNFDWEATLKVDDVARFIVGLTAGMYDLASGSNIIVINNSLKEDLRSVEMLYGFNTDTKEVHQVKS